jgi:transposase
MYVCILRQEGELLVHRHMKAAPEPFLKAMAPYREGLVVAVECLFPWYGLADLCAQEGLAFVWGPARSMRASHGGKATHDRIDAHKIAVLLRGGLRPQAYAYPAPRRATRDLRRRRTHLMHKRAALLAHVQHPNSQYNLPELGKKIASKANRHGVAERVAEPAGQKSIAVDLTRITYDDQRLTDLELSSVKAAKHHDANTRYLRQTVPGMGKMLRLVRLAELHDMHRFPRVQDFASYGRLVKSAKESAGKRLGTSGTNIGNAHLQWAVSEAAVLCLRQHPAAQKHLARLEHTHGKGKALTILAHKLARAVYDRLNRQTAFARDKFLPGSGRRAGEPAASLDTRGISLNGACPQSGSPASVNAAVRLGRLSQSLGPLIGHPRWLLNQWRESRPGDVGCPSPEPDTH